MLLPKDEETALMIVIEYRGYANGGEVVNKQLIGATRSIYHYDSVLSIAVLMWRSSNSPSSMRMQT